MTEFTMVRGVISPPHGTSIVLPTGSTTASGKPLPVSTGCDTCTSTTSPLSQISIPGTSITFSLNDTLIIIAFIIALVDLAIGLKR